MRNEQGVYEDMQHALTYNYNWQMDPCKWSGHGSYVHSMRISCNIVGTSHHIDQRHGRKPNVNTKK